MLQPSSSGRSAELLSSGGLGPAPALASGLASAVTGKPLPALFPTLAAASTDHYLNTDFMLCIKKLNKKDPITKTKVISIIVFVLVDLRCYGNNVGFKNNQLKQHDNIFW